MLSDETALIVVPGPAALPAQVVEDRFSLAHIASIADRAAAASELSRYQERCSAQTLRRQRADIELFAQYLTETGVQVSGDTLAYDLASWSAITHGIVQGFIAWSLQQGYATGSVNVRLATVKRYCELASRAGHITPDAFSLIRTVRGYKEAQARNLDVKRAAAGTRTRREKSKKAEPTSISPVHAALLKRQDVSERGRRDALFMCLLLDLGLRVSEIASLNRSSIDLAAGTLTFYRSKVHKTQTHALTPDTYTAARNYLGLFPDSEPDAPLFTSTLASAKKRRVDTRSLNERVTRLGRALGIENLSPHDCRHFWATDAMRNKTDVKSLQDAGGWSSPAMPLRYAESAKIANTGVKLTAQS